MMSVSGILVSSEIISVAVVISFYPPRTKPISLFSRCPLPEHLEI